MPIDTGFIVHNERTYPNLLRLFGELGVATQPTEMSMSISCEGCGLEYAGARGLAGLFAQPRLAGEPGLPADARRGARFHAHARRLLAHADADAGTDVDGLTLGTFLALGGYSDYFVRHFMIPVVVLRVVHAAPAPSLRVPGALPVPVPGQPRDALGDRLPAVAHRDRRLRTYVERAAKGLTGVRDRHRHPVGHPARRRRRARSTTTAQRHAADAVVVATHPDQALRLLGRPDRRRAGACSAPFDVLPQRDAAAHRPTRAAGRPAGPGLVELPDGRLRRRRPTTSRSATG